MRWNNRVLPACLITCLLTACGGLSYVTLQGDKELNPNRLGATSLGVRVKVFLLTERKGFDDAKLEEL